MQEKKFEKRTEENRPPLEELKARYESMMGDELSEDEVEFLWFSGML